MNPNFRKGDPDGTMCCSECGDRLPLDLDHFPPFGFYADGTQRYKSRCRRCARERQRQYNREHAELVKRSPELAERRRKQLADAQRRRRRDPKGKKKIRAQRKRYYGRVRKDSGRRKAAREAQRIKLRLQREREGVSLTEVRKVPGLMKSPITSQIPRLPARPLAMAIDASEVRRRREFFAGYTVGCRLSATASEYTPEADALGLAKEPGSGQRMVYAWRIGEREDAHFDTVDKVLTRGRWLWWEVYTPETVRKYAITVCVRRRVEKRTKVKRTPEAQFVTVQTTGEQYWAIRYSWHGTAERHYYGDLGTDWEALHEVEHAFTCEGHPYCWTCWAALERGKALKREREQGEQLELAEAA